MKKQGFSILIIGFMAFLLSACGGGNTKPSVSIPTIELQAVYNANKYFQADKFYQDKALTPFSSISSVTADLSEQAGANGSNAFLLTKSYEKQAKGTFMNGIHAFVEGWGITWKPASEKVLLADLKKVLDTEGGIPVIQAEALIVYITSKKIKKALPLLRELMTIRLIRKAERNRFISAYFTLGDASQNKHYVKMIKSNRGNIRINAIQALARFGTKKHKAIFKDILSKGQKARWWPICS